MKKILLAFAAVAVATCSQAAAYNWKTAKSGGVVNGPDTGAVLASGTAYLFTSSAAGTIFSSWVSGTSLDTLSALDSNSLSAGKIGTKEKTFDYSGDISAIFAITTTINGKDYLYISSVAEATVQDVGYGTIQFKETGTSSLASKLASGGYQGAGWYAVPEPTSGLLLLLGMAGLALRRKQV